MTARTPISPRITRAGVRANRGFLRARYPYLAGALGGSAEDHASDPIGQARNNGEFAVAWFHAEFQDGVVRSRARLGPMTVECRLRNVADETIDAGRIVTLG